MWVPNPDIGANLNRAAKNDRWTKERLEPKMTDDYELEQGDGRDDPYNREDEREPGAAARPQFEFITGTAGTGKTFLARQISQVEFGAELCATTGIAAINLGQGVTTINSKLGYFDTASLRDSFSSGALTRKLVRLFDRGVSRLVIDEISMMDGDQLLILCAALDEIEEQLGKQMGITLVGDFLQLPPVKAPFAFESEAFARFRPGITKLTEIRRQTDLDFIRGLQAVRRGARDEAMAFFESRLQRTTDGEYPGPTLLSKNVEVDRFNLIRHAKIQTTERWRWEATRWGKARGEWKLIPDKLELKTGALVMILANQPELDPLSGRPTGDYLYVNGDLGEIQGDDAGGALAAVKLQRNGRIVPVAKVTRENLIPLDKERRKILLAQEHGQNYGTGPVTPASVIRGSRSDYEAVGGVTYMPLRLAYATTVHKAQGLTLDNLQVSIVDRFWETPGMCYVALSRARTSNGLRIVGSKELFAKRINVDPRVREWM